MTKQPSLSVIMTNYNHSRFLPEALDAILAQSYPPFEIIIIDDASTDNSFQILENYARRYPLIRLMRSKKNMGAIHNANQLIKMASGDYVYGAAADDKILDGFFNKSMNILFQYPRAGLCSTLSFLIDENSANKGIHKTAIISSKACFVQKEKCRYLLVQNGTWIQGNTTIYRRKALIEAGGFMPELHSFCDGFIQQVIALRHGVCFIPEPLAGWRKMETGFVETDRKDHHKTIDITQHAAMMMRTTYGDLFPKQYINDFERNKIYSAGIVAWTKVVQQQEDFFSNVFCRLRPGNNLSDRLFAILFKLNIKLQAIALKIYLTLYLKSLRSFMIQCIRRGSRRFFKKKIDEILSNRYK